MATLRIPTSSGADPFPNYEIEVELDGELFKLDFRYNGRMSSWVMNLRDINGVILRSGISVVSGIPLLQRMKQLTRPDGVLMAVPVAADDINAAGLEQLGSDVIMTYTEA